jgi:hypothetical protein
MTRKATALADGNTSSQRPDLVPGVPIYAANQTIDHWFNPAAFALPANGAWGNLGRYIAHVVPRDHRRLHRPRSIQLELVR